VRILSYMYEYLLRNGPQGQAQIRSRKKFRYARGTDRDHRENRTMVERRGRREV
jgi:hypothetical protein